MIQRTDQLAQLNPTQRAQVIFSEAQSALSNRLWKAALGDSDRSEDRDASPFSGGNMKMDSLLELLQGQMPGGTGVGAAGCQCHCACSCHNPTASQDESFPSDDLGDRSGAGLAAREPMNFVAGAASGATGAGLQLGANARYAGALAAAEARTGIPASAVAAIVDAEAAKGHDGSWNTHSRNPRSSAAGLGQFLSGTWQHLAETRGTWLNDVAAKQGWLDGAGKVQGGAKAELLALRYDPQASILGVADLAKLNVDKLEKLGIRAHTDAETLAKAAYLGHHLGLGDARKFLAGGIEPGRARMLLAAQIGAGAADQRIASAGNATQAHRQWLLGFIERRIRPQNFAA
jgi:hypothetical protein